MRRCYVPPEHLVEDTLQLTGEEYHHLVRVLRLKPGERVRLFDGVGREAIGEIQEIERRYLTLQVIERNSVAPPTYSVTLYQGLPKLHQWEWILQKTTELGITQIVPVWCERSVPRFSSGELERRLERWERIVREAGKQCGCSYLPQLRPPLDWIEAIATSDGSGILLWEGETERSFRSIVGEIGTDRKVSLFVGPEGGLAKEEVEEAREVGIPSVTLGSNILRTETAAVVAVALILYELGELGG